MRLRLLLVSLTLAVPAGAQRAGNRLTYLDGNDPYYVSLAHARLITPQWVGTPGVEAVVTLAIDDMNKPSPWVPFLKPTLKRLADIYGRSPVSIMTTRVRPDRPEWQALLRSGVSIECHTYDHPCPILRGRSFEAAKSTYERCVDLMCSIPGNRPVAFRVPCCDSRNTPSPRFYAEIFNKTTANGNWLALDSSVFDVLTPDDPDLPRDLVVDRDGGGKFKKYLPFRSFVNTIENYPYPYVIGRLCWEFPCVTPSDWSAQNLNAPRSPRSFEDLKAALDAVVIKRGVYNLVFHPYGWSHHDQIVELVDHAVTRHGRKVLFLSFKDCLARLEQNLLAKNPLRAKDGGDNGVRILDLDDDGYMDVVIGNDEVRLTRVWSPADGKWIDSGFPIQLVTAKGGPRRETGARFGILRKDGNATLLVKNEKTAGAWHFDGRTWQPADELLDGLEIAGKPILTSKNGIDQGVRLRDVDADGRCELLVANPTQRAAFEWREGRWRRLPFALPPLTRIADAEGRDAGLRFVDVDDDGKDDVIFSNEHRYSLHLYRSRAEGWSTEVSSATRGPDNNEIPMITRAGTDNGAWFHSRHMWVQNEDTAHLPDLVDRRSFGQLLASVEPRPKSPEAALAAIAVRPGFRVELVAAEPLVRDPVAIAWGLDGRLWVAEMADYPLGIDGRGKPGGRVRHLEDTDGDGRYDRSTVFADGLPFPTGVHPWKNGVLVTAAPDILYLEDTDGDGVADRREVLFTGFRRGNQQHRINGLRPGLDNWIYCANGDSGGTVRSVATGTTVDIRGSDLRVRPDTGQIAVETGMTQFGRYRDDWGNWFGGNNSRQIWHFVLADRYLRRNPYFAPPEPRVDLMTPPWNAPVFPISRTVERFNDLHTANRFTSACGGCVYRDELFGPHFSGAYFVCEPVHNLVHAGRMTRNGVTFTGKRLRGEEKSEFLASPDNWFRPVQARTGPDGALWIVDMYRQVIEHPQWIPDDWQARLDLRAGHDKGRIYRVVPVTKPARRLESVRDTASLVELLESPNGPLRDLAQQELVTRNDSTVVPRLVRMVETAERPTARLHALCTLDGLGAVPTAMLVRALGDPHAAVRRYALRICEPRLATTPALHAPVLALAGDRDPAVLLQLASTLGEWKDSRAGAALAKLALDNANDRFVIAAVLSSALPHLEQLIASTSRNGPVAVLCRLVDLAVRADDVHAITTALRALADPRAEPWQLDVLGAVVDALSSKKSSLAKWQASADPELSAAIASLGSVFDAARKLAGSQTSEAASRVRAIRLLGRGLDSVEDDLRALSDLLALQSPVAVQLAAVDAIAKLARPGVAERLLAGWKGYGPSLRTRIVDLLLTRGRWTEALLDRLEREDVEPSSLTAEQRQRLTSNRRNEIKQRASKLLTPPSTEHELAALERKVLALTGDPRRGADVFNRHCTICHRLGGLGYNVGPDLRSLTDRSPESLLTAVLEPGRAVEARYTTYFATLADDRQLTGIIADETSASLALIGARGERHVIPRSQLREIASTGTSLMPNGFEQLIAPQGLADLIAWVAKDHPRAKEFAGNQPALVRPAGDGSLLLTASNAELYGPEIYYYAKPRVIGDWHRPEDRAVWSIEIVTAGDYDVHIEWACAQRTAGNTLLVEANTGRVTEKVAGTGKGWNRYRTKRIGRLRLLPGLQSIVLRSKGPIARQALLDLRSVRLVPAGRRP